MANSLDGDVRGTDSGGLALVRGDGANSERVLRSTIRALEGVDGSHVELASALLQLGDLRQATGNHAEAEEFFKRALDVGDGALGPDDPQLVPALTRLGTARLLRGAFDEAEVLFARALTITERRLGENHPDLVILINDFTRLCLKHSAHALAEPLLLRLLTVKRRKGESHPEVATVLASLAVVRQAVGRHESAEQLWRRVLEIREQTLAPNHIGLANALERLADACASRGKVTEALQLLRRAQTVRELTLGTDHSSFKVLRERIADLQLQASEDLLDSDDADSFASAPDGGRQESTDRHVMSVPVIPPPERERSAVTPVWSAARVVEYEPSLKPAAGTAPAQPAPADAAVTDAREREAAAIAHRQVLVSLMQEIEDTDERDAPVNRAEALFASAVGLVRKQPRGVASVAGVMILLLVVLASNSFAGSEMDQTATELPSDELLPIVTASLTGRSSRPPMATIDPSKVSAISGARATSEVTTRSSRVAEPSSSARNVSERKPAPASISIPKVLKGLNVDLESVVRAVGVPAPTVGASGPVALAPGGASTRRWSFSDGDAAATLQHARLIGAVPTPRYPRELHDVDGEVQIRFTVDTDGRPVMSTLSVVSTSHALFTAAVRNVVPAMRFEPARSGGSDPQLMAETVELGFRFVRSAK